MAAKTPPLQRPLKRVPQSQSMMYPKDKNFQFNPSSDIARISLMQPFDNGINMVKGPPIADIAIPPEPPTTETLLEEWGSTGTIIVGGILSNVDYNLDLTGVQRVDIYDQMRKGDATVRAALLAVKLPIIAANWRVHPFTEGDSQHEEIAEFIDQQLFHKMDISWNDWIRHCMNYLDYGSMVFEKLFRMLPNGQIGWQKFAPRLTKTIYRWRMPDNVTEGITQIIPTGGLRGIPKWKLMVFINEQEGEDYEGISLLRFAYKHWIMKDTYYKIDGIAAERQGLGVPWVKVPPNANDQDRNKIDELLRNLRTNEEANIQVPVGWEFGMLDMKTNGTKNVKDMVLHHDRQIVKSVLAQFLELGSTQTGSFALSSNQSELFLLSLKAIANKIQEVLNNTAIRELVDLNYQVPEDQYPELEYGRIGQVDFEKLSVALFRLAQGGLIQASPDLEAYIAQAMDLPEPQSTPDTKDDVEEITLPVPKQIQKVSKPVQVYSREKQMDRFEETNKYAIRKFSEDLGYDVREMRREIRAILSGTY